MIWTLLFVTLASSTYGEPLKKNPGSPTKISPELCEPCLVVTHVLSDFLCDFEFQGWAAKTVDETVCEALDKDSQEQCFQLVNALLPVAIEYLRAYTVPSQLCSIYCNDGGRGMAQLKPQTAWSPSAVAVRSSECGQCRFVARSVKADIEVAEPYSPAAVREAALKACRSLPEDMMPSCEDFVDSKVSLLASFIGYDKACEITGACLMDAFLAATKAAAPSGHAAPSPAIPARLLQVVAGLLAAAKEASVTAASATHTTPKAVSSAGCSRCKREDAGAAAGQVGDTTPCDKCMLYVLQLRMMLQSTAVQTEITNVTWAQCVHFEPYAEQCRQAVNLYAPVVFKLLLEYFQPDPVCRELRICPAPPHMQFPRAGSDDARISSLAEEQTNGLRGWSNRLRGAWDKLSASRKSSATN